MKMDQTSRLIELDERILASSCASQYTITNQTNYLVQNCPHILFPDLGLTTYRRVSLETLSLIFGEFEI